VKGSPVPDIGLETLTRENKFIRFEHVGKYI